LTTNRVGVLDEAINSRVHLSIYYPPLDSSQTLALFDANLARLAKIAQERAAATGKPRLDIRQSEIRQFAMRAFDSRPDKMGPWWNGRQIRNAFQIASSLAYSGVLRDRTANRTQNPDRCYIGKEHFEEIQKAIDAYDKNRQGLFHMNDAERAEHREERKRRDEEEDERVAERYGSGRRDDRYHGRPDARHYGPSDQYRTPTRPSYGSSASRPAGSWEPPPERQDRRYDYPPREPARGSSPRMQPQERSYAQRPMSPPHSRDDRDMEQRYHEESRRYEEN
jgi:hypothetical protein